MKYLAVICLAFLAGCKQSPKTDNSVATANESTKTTKTLNLKYIPSNMPLLF